MHCFYNQKILNATMPLFLNIPAVNPAMSLSFKHAVELQLFLFMFVFHCCSCDKPSRGIANTLVSCVSVPAICSARLLATELSDCLQTEDPVGQHTRFRGANRSCSGYNSRYSSACSSSYNRSSLF